VLHSRAPSGIAQELYALLTCYQIWRIAITDAIEATDGIDPDRGSFTIALNATRNLLTQAANIIAGTIIDLIGAIGRASWTTCCPTGGCASAPHRQTRDLQIPGQRPQHQPAQLQSHPRDQHPHCRTLTRPGR
jgi:hypothetical protein